MNCYFFLTNLASTKSLALVSLPFLSPVLAKCPSFICWSCFLTYFYICSCRIKLSLHSGYTPTDRLTEVTSTLCCQSQHFGLLLPLVHVKIVISVYETVMKDKVLLLEESKCCLLVLPDSYSQYHRGVKEPLNIDDGRPTEVKKIHFDFLNPAWMHKKTWRLFFFFLIEW